MPIVVAINKIDRVSAEPKHVFEQLATYGLKPHQLGGDVPCVLVSAKNRKNLASLEKALKDISHEVDLKEDFSSRAQCLVIDTSVDAHTHLITATLLVQSGVLHQEDYIVCGTDEGRVKAMDRKVATPGQVVTVMGGFKHVPEVGHPLYSVESHEQAVFMATKVR